MRSVGHDKGSNAYVTGSVIDHTGRARDSGQALQGVAQLEKGDTDSGSLDDTVSTVDKDIVALLIPVNEITGAVKVSPRTISVRITSSVRALAPQ